MALLEDQPDASPQPMMLLIGSSLISIDFHLHEDNVTKNQEFIDRGGAIYDRDLGALGDVNDYRNFRIHAKDSVRWTEGSGERKISAAYTQTLLYYRNTCTRRGHRGCPQR